MDERDEDETAEPAGGDRALRALTHEGGFRVITVRTTEMVRRAAEVQGTSGETARLFGELLTGAVLVRETMAPGLRVQILLNGPHGSSVMADAHPEGLTRGLVRKGDDGEPVRLRTGTESVLQVIRNLPDGKLHRGVVDAGGSEDVSAALMSYLQNSEQVTSTLVVACTMEGERIRSAGGYVVQLLPEVDENRLMVMTERLEDFRRIGGLLDERDADPDDLLGELLYRMPHDLLDERPVHFGCQCSQVRVLTAMATLGQDELQEMVQEGGAFRVDCEYCGQPYQVGAEQLRSLLETT